jgi:hypothetical protein
MEEEKRGRKKREKRRCLHKRQRKVIGKDGKLLWYECVDCNLDYPLRD